MYKKKLLIKKHYSEHDGNQSCYDQIFVVVNSLGMQVCKRIHQTPSISPREHFQHQPSFTLIPPFGFSSMLSGCVEKRKLVSPGFHPIPLEIGAENNLCCLLLDSDPAVITQLWFFMEVLGLLVAVWSSVYDMAPRLDLHQHWLVPSPPLLLLLLFNLLLLLLLHCVLFQTTQVVMLSS